jgi:HAD superfamily hydrolase (TIGR01549 family)
MIDKPLILFDMDGTLITLQEQPAYQGVSTDYTSYVSLRQQMKKIASSHGIPQEEIDHLNRMAHIWNKTRAYAESHGFDEVQIEALMRAINEPFKQEESVEHEKSILMPDTLEVLETLQKEGYPLGLVTNASRIAYERLSNNNDYGMFGKYFEYSITRDDCDFIKPNPEPIQRMLCLFRRTNFIYVGDSDHDSQATKEANGVFILINTREYDDQTLKTLNPKAIISSLTELQDILEKL